ncbi:Topoisomerase 1-associated factor 1 [Rhynchospora pubera]|uniref:Topoisomerase 1-associated factor 1 n=1 Tax=Rhynchospora pubera TaxID=906938 RepID=A0AAV8DQ77_9POAL|nr:Topoisomerase 1-associated factor 1 [Rhynchospora pubera]
MDSDRLSSICAGLGTAEEDENGAIIGYTKGEYCLDNLKDLQRYLRRDNPQKRDVFKQICKWNTVSRDLIPIIESYQNDRNLVIATVKILVFLTLPVDPTSYEIAQQIEYLWALKAAMARNVTIAVFVSLLEDPLDHLESDAFTEEDWKLVQLVITLFRNLLAIREITSQQKARGSAAQLLQLDDTFLELMFQENVMDVILVLTQHVEEDCGFIKQDKLLLLEIFHYIFLGRDPELVARSCKKGSQDGELSSSVDSLISIIEEESLKRKAVVQRSLDHSGTFSRIFMDGSKTLHKSYPACGPGGMSLEVHKVQRGPQKRIAWDHPTLAPLKENLQELLRNFLEQFLSGGYNVLMQSIRQDIKKEHPSIQNSDIITFFQVVQFVLAFQYHHVSISKKAGDEDPLSEALNNQHGSANFKGDICGPVAETINEEMFNLVLNRWRETFEGLKQTNDYKSLSAAGSLMKNMIFMIDLVLKLLPESSGDAHTARVLLYKLFYDQTDQGFTQLLLNLFRSFKMDKQPKSDLSDLLEIIHVIFRLMERLQARGSLRVAKKARRIRRKKVTNDHPETKQSTETDSTAIPDTSEIPTEPSKTSSDQPVEDPQIQSDATQRSVDLHEQTNSDPLVGIDQGTSGSSSDDDDELPATSEVDFNVSRLVGSFLNNTVVHNLCWLLKHYKTNSARTNHYILCMLRRICDDLGMAPMLYQLSLLTIFYTILADQKSSRSREHSSITNFLTKLVRDMLKLIKKQPLLFVDILFWKTKKECHCISADAIMSDMASLKKDINALNGTAKGFPRSIADSLGDDEADLVVPHYTESQREDFSDTVHENNSPQTNLITKKRRGPRSLSDEDRHDNDSTPGLADDVGGKVVKRRSSIFSPEQENMLKDLYEKHKDDRACCRLIASALDPDNKISPAQVSRKLKQLGLRNNVRKRKTAEKTDPQFSSTDDEETLQTLVNRLKGSSLGKDVSSEKSQEEEAKEWFGSDNDTLASLPRLKKKRNMETKKSTIEHSSAEKESYTVQDTVHEDFDSPELLDDDMESEPDNAGSTQRSKSNIESLEDSDDGANAVALSNIGPKRNLRLVFDDDDEED